MPRLKYQQSAPCPDCGQTITTLGHIIVAHHRPMTDTRNVICSASNMPCIEGETAEEVDAWTQHVRDGGD